MSGYLKLDVGVGRVKVVVDDADSGTGISRGEPFLNEEWSSRPRPLDIRTVGGLNRCGMEGLASEHELERPAMGAENAEVCSNSRIVDLADSLSCVSGRRGDLTPH